MLAKQTDLEEYIAYLDEKAAAHAYERDVEAAEPAHRGIPYQIISYPTPTTRTVLDTFPNYAAAKHAAEERFQISYYEQDTTITYTAADFITEQGAIYSIEPSKEK
jgi:hypothetical protein